MFVSTFYSFKGGVGRSLALMNVAVTLTQRGKRVLVVDFDLEAPGLTTFSVCSTASGGEGLVEFISMYRSNRSVPTVSHYIHECSTSALPQMNGEGVGSLSIMPAGNVDDPGYPGMFAKLDWRALYDDEEGFLLFDELRAQWEDLGYDYVLIDSRTGHTDISGICTRQLPDAVVMVFFPNEQNLAGLKQIVADVRNEPSAIEPIALKFVASRIPRLDDEYDILEHWLTRFQNELKYDSDSLLKIHHYDSLALLDQKIFVLDRPKTSLSKEMKALAGEIAMLNPEDADGAAAFLSGLARQSKRDAAELGGDDAVMRADNRVEKIMEKHGGDYVIMFLLANYYYKRSFLTEAAKAVDSAMLSDGNTSVSRGVTEGIRVAIHALRMRIYRDLEQEEISSSSAIELLRAPKLTSSTLRDALITLAFTSPGKLPAPEAIPALEELSATELVKSFLALNFSRETVRYSARALRWIIVRHGIDALTDEDRLNASLRLIAGAEPQVARKLINATPVTSDFEQVAYAFNGAVADWATEGAPNQEAFQQALDLGSRMGLAEGNYEANFYQCLSLAAAVTGKRERANELLDSAIRSAEDHAVQMFSCWSYLDVPVGEFLVECSLLRSFINDGTPEPEVVTRSRTSFDQ